MPATLDQVSCADGYAIAATIEDIYGSSGGFFSVTGSDAFVELQNGVRGQAHFYSEVHLPQGAGTLLSGTTGIRFRNYVAGQVAVVTAALYYPAEPPLIISAVGQVVTAPAASAVTGLVSSAGAVLAGTGFTASRTGVGLYTVTFTAMFAAAPLVLAQVVGNASATIGVFNVSTGGFDMSIRNPPTGAALDESFFFTAEVIT